MQEEWEHEDVTTEDTAPKNAGAMRAKKSRLKRRNQFAREIAIAFSPGAALIANRAVAMDALTENDMAIIVHVIADTVRQHPRRSRTSPQGPAGNSSALDQLVSQ